MRRMQQPTSCCRALGIERHLQISAIVRPEITVTSLLLGRRMMQQGAFVKSLRNSVLTLVCAGLLPACASYHSMPLPPASDFVSAPPAGALDITAVGDLALERSPDLVARRRQAAALEAQARETGLLPDLQLSTSADRPVGNLPGLTNAYGLALSQDLQRVLTRRSRASSATARARQAQLELLWAEWQTVQDAATLYATKVFADRKVMVLSAAADVLTAQSNRSLPALEAHDTTIDVAGSDLSAALDIASQKDAALRSALAADSGLKALLNLAPIVDLQLAALSPPEPISRKDLETALGNVPQRRPDLLALQAGYRAQEESVRAAILQQFPAISIGYSRARDTSDIRTNGLAVTFNIPIGATRARIRAERATRAQLLAEYQARLDNTEADAWRIWQTLTLLRDQIEGLSARLPQLRQMASTSQQAYEAGNLLPATYVLLQTTLSTRESELLDLENTLWTNTIALHTLLAMPPIQPQSEEAQK